MLLLTSSSDVFHDRISENTKNASQNRTTTTAIEKDKISEIESAVKLFISEILEISKY